MAGDLMVDGSADSTPEHKDRSVGLVIFGVLQILIGLGCAALVPLILMAQWLGSVGGVASIDARTTISTMILYATAAAIFVWLGIGSIRARRWARELSLSLAWLWLLTGICTLILAVMILPSALSTVAGERGFPHEMAVLIPVVTTAVLVFGCVLLPGSLLVFYRSPHVAATCRARGPSRQWTDDLPQRLLTLTIVWVLAAIQVFGMPAYNFVVSFFGVVLAGWAGAVVWAVILIVCVALAWGSARRELWAWRGAVIAVLLAGLSTVITSLRVETLELARAMDLPDDQAALITDATMPDQWVVILFWIVAWGSFLVYLATVRRFFVVPPAGDDG